ncbi:tyrosine-type recombinase/integrase [Achromobacter insuavis]|nr:tyrosine-type recombinase/integrase [Achromobacter insuavis]
MQRGEEMGRSKTNGVYPSGDGTFEVDARYKKQRIRKRGFESQAEATDYLIQQREEIRVSLQFLADPKKRVPVTLEEAATQLLKDKEGMPSAVTDAYMLEPLVAWNGSLTIDKLCDATLRGFIEDRRRAKWKNKTINNALECVRTILKRAVTKWQFPNGATWLPQAPSITMLPLTDQRPPRPITWAEQAELLKALPPYLAAMAEFDLNTGVRRRVVCMLSWDWEVRVTLRPGLEVSVFVVPREFVKGRKAERLIVCNSAAQHLVNSQRGLHPERVFVYPRRTRKGQPQAYVPVATMWSPAWVAARTTAGLGDLHVHDLRHTVGMRLRAAGVSERTQNEILWHTQASNMTHHYAVAQLREIYDALELMNQQHDEGESLNLWALMRKMRMKALPQKSPSLKLVA